MALSWKLVQQILRDATEDDAFEVRTEKVEVYQDLRLLQKSLREICDQGRVMTESEVAGSRFRYALTGGQSAGPQSWLEAVERAIQIVEQCTTVEEIRGYLVTRKRSYTDFTSLTH